MKKRYNFTLDESVKTILERFAKENFTTMSAVLTSLILELQSKKIVYGNKLPSKRISQN
jgi:chromatin remodeling complex protein RSC6